MKPTPTQIEAAAKAGWEAVETTPWAEATDDLKGFARNFARAALSVPAAAVVGEPVDLQGIVAFERTYPDLFYKIGKGRLSPDEPMYGAIIEMADGEPIGEGESNVSVAAAFEAALADSELPIPAGYPTVSKQDVLQALDTLMRANGYDLDRWTGENLSFDELRDAYRHALVGASHDD